MNPPDVPQCCGDPSTCNDPCEPVKPLDDPHLQQVFGWAIEGAMASGYQNTNPAPEGHWLAPWWQRGRNAALANEQMVNGLTEAETAATASCAGLSREGSVVPGDPVASLPTPPIAAGDVRSGE